MKLPKIPHLRFENLYNICLFPATYNFSSHGDIKFEVNKLPVELETMIAIALIIANVVVVNGSGAPFFLWPKLQDYEKGEQLGIPFLNKSVNPCNDFYEYTCGDWIEKTVQPESQLLWNHWQSVTQIMFRRIEIILQSEQPTPTYLLKAKNMYNACLRNKNSGTKYLINLKTIIDGLNGWPMVAQDWNASGYDWAINVAKITRILGVHPLLKMHVFIDMQNTSQHILYIEQGELNLPQTILLYQQKYKQYIKAYRVWILETTRYLFPNTTSNLKVDITEMINFEIQLAKLNLYRDKSEKISINTLSKEFPMKWKAIFDQLFYFTSVDIQSNDMVTVRSRKYLTHLLFLLSNSKTETIANYLIWSVVKHLSRDTTKYMRKLNFIIDNKILGIKKDISRTQECVNKINTYMGVALIPKYFKLYLSPQILNEVSNMTENIKMEFIKILNQNSWLDDATKNLVVEKIRALKYVIAYPEWLNNDTLLENTFKEVNISNNHFRNIIQLNSFKIKNELQKLRQPVDFEVRNYGALGSLIGHEISHALDTLGRHADKNGNIRKWWSQKDIDEYEESITCFKRQYNNYNVNGINTLGENIADNVGLQISYNAFKNMEIKKVYASDLNKFTEDQLFFISFSQLWCEIPSENELTNEEEYAPVKTRVLGTLRNSKEFDKTFYCKADTEKCTLW